jgi:membrane protease YdiL (CAAX protease family)
MSETRTNRGWPLVAWLVILAVVGLILWRNSLPMGESTAGWLVPMQMQGRYLVGAANSGFPGLPKADLYKQAKETLDKGSDARRLRFAVLAGELSGPEEARRILVGLEPSTEGTLLSRLYGGAKLSTEEKATLETSLGWFGDLAVGFQDDDARARALRPARRTFFGLMGVVLAGLGALVVGGLLIVLLAVFAHKGKLRSGVVPGGGNGGIYAETFALYLVLYFGLGFLSHFLPWRELWVGGIVMILSLAALAWPVIRGVRWADMRHDLGLYSGGIADIPLGIGTYLSAIPLLALGLLVMFGMMVVRKRMGLDDPAGEGPSHPIIAIALSGSAWAWVQMVFVACVLAPLVEETLFRGALYQHLREIGPGLAKWASVTFSVLVSGFVFAAIHPQGWLGVPVLMSLATAFALSREWRGSLVPAMIAHGINNGMTTLMLLTFAA